MFTLGTLLSIDEMMICFMGQSLETICGKNKLFGEDYKFFVLEKLNGYVVHFTPDGRTATKNNKTNTRKKERQENQRQSWSLSGRSLTNSDKNRKKKSGRHLKRHNKHQSVKKKH